MACISSSQLSQLRINNHRFKKLLKLMLSLIKIAMYKLTKTPHSAKTLNLVFFECIL